MNDYDESAYRRIVEKRLEIWTGFLRGLEDSSVPDHTVVRFPNSSTYIFSTGKKTFWMMDPSFDRGEPDAIGTKIIADEIKRKISFIIITHLHRDHCQMDLVNLLADSPIRWVVPESCVETFCNKGGVGKEKVIAMGEGSVVTLDGVTIMAHEGFHYDAGKAVQIPSSSYDVELSDGVRLFFPGDIRDFQAHISDTSPVDYTFGHVFLGREDATGNDFSHLEDFAAFMMQRECACLFLTHLYDIGRQAKDLWTVRHALMVKERIVAEKPGQAVVIPRFGDQMCLERP